MEFGKRTGFKKLIGSATDFGTINFVLEVATTAATTITPTVLKLVFNAGRGAPAIHVVEIVLFVFPRLMPRQNKDF